MNDFLVAKEDIEINSGEIFSMSELLSLFDEMKEETVSITDLVGIGALSGVEIGIVSNGSDGCYERNYIDFKLNDKVYRAIEDDNDGYRSMCEKIVVLPSRKIEASFEPVVVYGIMGNGNPYSKDEVINFYDIITNKIVLSIGTENADDYYPTFIMNWIPENLCLNNY